MYSTGYPNFDPDHQPSPGAVNALKLMIWALVHTRPHLEADVSADWIADNIPAWGNNWGELNRPWGLVDDTRPDDEMDYLTASAIVWDDETEAAIEKHTGFRPDIADPKAWIAANWTNLRWRGTRPGFKASVKKVSKFVAQASYTRAEAEIAKAEIERQVLANKMDPRSAAAFKAHISRRTQKQAA